MDAKRRAAQEPEVVIQWFKGYEKLRISKDIKAENVWNFDETNVRNACPGSVWVWVPIEIKEVYCLVLFINEQSLYYFNSSSSTALKIANQARLLSQFLQLARQSYYS